ncbi:hypothetical protein [Franzmannia qiaohouensis]|uniref:Uncharacterized protein n=1 Tax=Franzmannia qiaohouensis TaxID=1329370 RepID=A0ABU1HM13_9GAMM|nr:hypothetical protein [Halomonas qiaohouensis]MDR5907590.1 hypothetical protein [Halomonas qiaohouensis]
MAKGIKMVCAYKRELETATVRNIQELSKADNGSLFCEDPRCRTRVEYNSGYTRLATNTTVSPYLKLAKDCCHAAECKNSISGAVKVFVGDSRDVENVPDIFEDTQDGSFTFRLNLLEQSRTQLNKLSDKMATEPEGSSLGKEYVETKKRLASYCKSAAGISRLRSLIQDRSDVEDFESLVKIQYKDRQVMWKDFFYDDERYHVLYNRLSRSRIEHPIAIRVTAKQVKSSKVEQYPVSIQCYAETEEQSSYIPWVNLHQDLKDLELSSGQSYIVLGHVSNSEKDRFKNLKFAINNRQQIVRER